MPNHSFHKYLLDFLSNRELEESRLQRISPTLKSVSCLKAHIDSHSTKCPFRQSPHFFPTPLWAMGPYSVLVISSTVHHPLWESSWMKSHFPRLVQACLSIQHSQSRSPCLPSPEETPEKSFELYHMHALLLLENYPRFCLLRGKVGTSKTLLLPLCHL